MSLATPVTPTPAVAEVPFVDRRQQSGSGERGERRQFGNSYNNLSREGRQLAEAIDSYKVEHHRRYITTDELIGVLTGLGYQRSDGAD
ncbi:MAG: hypothetical protein NTY15_13205 [Planctomycetota bacterium]|jgi:hypothetical protein|nr:hypothetical protein [Planctomycetota bacterium]